MCGTTYSSLQSSDTLNYRRMITDGASESLYCTVNSKIEFESNLQIEFFQLQRIVINYVQKLPSL